MWAFLLGSLGDVRTSKWCDFKYSQPVIFATSPKSRNKGQARQQNGFYSICQVQSKVTKILQLLGKTMRGELTAKRNAACITL